MCQFEDDFVTAMAIFAIASYNFGLLAGFNQRLTTYPNFS